MIVDIDAVDRGLAVRSITRLEAELFGRGAWNERMVRDELDAPARTYLLDIEPPAANAGDAGDVAGELSGAPAASDEPVIRGYAGFWYDGEDAELMTIGVGKAYQRRGIAAALLAALVDEAKRQGAARMLLEVRVDNDPAMALYQRFGFERMGLRKRYYQPEGIDAYTMSLDLNPRIVGFAPSHTALAQTASDAGGAGAADAPHDAKESNENTTTNGATR
ncbi:ribosomal protein S18-alanine N-acetyltransferase [Bifidobacterium scardovii]|uniref:Acetyltransferase n=2 Tax=Bifidobacterium scardovii TaxID=158787 RepID=A0A087DI88_9BIFI|nr:ribosomal protein S18-alanine N-acetyltransferase [Bifidobacterium scardovii]KFI95238.1 acetyltransferase [Bifidobacterium scardovii]MDK6350248.1 ribosomal protein S18-alanine N-acetyltransferase [Bifidobacterium scardovii]MDU8981342.1 ribosomal protein S18-alanine N-acetyltransferase [Bifidobacterium scardovii]BAQ31626.1 putative ribosomal-protein-alanine N-acetyltransferase [Bifidobacterium scardovii JCM 12489 = DSM 13734]